jgi:hypothetical protein
MSPLIEAFMQEIGFTDERAAASPRDDFRNGALHRAPLDAGGGIDVRLKP